MKNESTATYKPLPVSLATTCCLNKHGKRKRKTGGGGTGDTIRTGDCFLISKDPIISHKHTSVFALCQNAHICRHTHKHTHTHTLIHSCADWSCTEKGRKCLLTHNQLMTGTVFPVLMTFSPQCNPTVCHNNVSKVWMNHSWSSGETRRVIRTFCFLLIICQQSENSAKDVISPKCQPVNLSADTTQKCLRAGGCSGSFMEVGGLWLPSAGESLKYKGVHGHSCL